MSHHPVFIEDWEEIQSSGEDFADIPLTPSDTDEDEEFHIIDWDAYSQDDDDDDAEVTPRAEASTPCRRVDDIRNRELPPIPVSEPQELSVAEFVEARINRLARSHYKPRTSRCFPKVKDFDPQCLGRPFREKFIKKIIANEKRFVEVLDFIDSDVVKPLYFVKPPIVSAAELSDLMKVAFSDILVIRRCHHSHLDALSDRCYAVGDLFLDLAEAIKPAYLDYIAKLPKTMSTFQTLETNNAAFSLFSFLVGERLSLRAKHHSCPRDTDNLLRLPIRYLQKLEAMLGDLLLVTWEDHPDVPHLTKAIEIIRNLLSSASSS